MLLNDVEAYRIMSLAHNPYCDGQSAGRIIGVLKKLILTMNEGFL